MSAGIDGEVLLARLQELGGTGRDERGRLARLAASDADRAGRDLLARWLEAAGLELAVDAIGNLFGIWQAGTGQPVMVGSHIDTVIDAGIYDGCYGVLAGLAVAEALRAEGLVPARPLVVAAFTNEEGVRFAPDMMGSLVHAGGLDLDQALASVGTDGTVLGEELRRIGYAGSMAPGTIRPAAYLELHVEQGPVLERAGAAIGAVEDLQGISWQRLRVEGRANHAGTTPMALRRDAGHAAARIVTGLRALAQGGTVATVGSLRLEPDAINVIPGTAVLTADLRNPDEGRLVAAEATLAGLVAEVAAEEGVTITAERLARFQPVRFDPALVALIERAAAKRGLPVRRMTSGAGHDAQMLARICPSAMIFVPSRDGISHNAAEYTAPEALAAGTEVLLDVVRELLAASGEPS